MSWKEITDRFVETTYLIIFFLNSENHSDFYISASVQILYQFSLAKQKKYSVEYEQWKMKTVDN